MGNWMQRIARCNNNDFYMTMHDDAYTTNKNVILKFISNVERIFTDNQKLGWVGTKYDALCAYRMTMIDEIGEQDYFIRDYGIDTDTYTKIHLAKWNRTVDTETSKNLIHLISVKAKSEPLFKMKVDLESPFMWTYLNHKWGITKESVDNGTWHSNMDPPYLTPFNKK
jgi:hypothetical protein